MRPKFVFTLLIFCVAIIGVIFYWKQNSQSSFSTPAAPETVPLPTQKAMSIHFMVPEGQPPKPETVTAPAPVVSANSLTPDQHQAVIDAEVERLQQLAMNDDPVSLKAILADLTSPEKEIRDAAIDAAKNFGSQDAIPDLKTAVDATDDILEKIALLEAVEFLSLPSVTFGPPATATPEQLQAEGLKRAKRHSPSSKIPQIAPLAPNQ